LSPPWWALPFFYGYYDGQKIKEYGEKI